MEVIRTPTDDDINALITLHSKRTHGGLSDDELRAYIILLSRLIISLNRGKDIDIIERKY